MNETIHKDLAAGRWQRLTLSEQLGNIGSEVSRAARSQGKDVVRFEKAAERAFELFDITLADPRHRGRLREISRLYEVFADAIEGGYEYGTTLKGLEKYFTYFALAARIQAGV
jgi:hypothetical protein